MMKFLTRRSPNGSLAVTGFLISAQGLCPSLFTAQTLSRYLSPSVSLVTRKSLVDVLPKIDQYFVRK